MDRLELWACSLQLKCTAHCLFAEGPPTQQNPTTQLSNHPPLQTCKEFSRDFEIYCNLELMASIKGRDGAWPGGCREGGTAWLPLVLVQLQCYTAVGPAAQSSSAPSSPFVVMHAALCGLPSILQTFLT